MNTYTSIRYELQSFDGREWVSAPVRSQVEKDANIQQLVEFAIYIAPGLADRRFRIIQVIETTTTETLVRALALPS